MDQDLLRLPPDGGLVVVLSPPAALTCDSLPVRERNELAMPQQLAVAHPGTPCYQPGAQPVGDSLPDARAQIEEGGWMATVLNVSSDGIGLIANRPFKPGMILTVELPVNGQGPKRTTARLVRITHGKPHPKNRLGNQTWILGGVFVEKLTRMEIERLHSRSPSIVPQRTAHLGSPYHAAEGALPGCPGDGGRALVGEDPQHHLPGHGPDCQPAVSLRRVPLGRITDVQWPVARQAAPARSLRPTSGPSPVIAGGCSAASSWRF